MGLNANMLTGFAGDVIVYTVIIIIRLRMLSLEIYSAIHNTDFFLSITSTQSFPPSKQ